MYIFYVCILLNFSIVVCHLLISLSDYYCLLDPTKTFALLSLLVETLCVCTIYGVKSGLYVLLQEQSITSWYCVKECCYVFGLFGESDASPALTIKTYFMVYR